MILKPFLNQQEKSKRKRFQRPIFDSRDLQNTVIILTRWHLGQKEKSVIAEHVNFQGEHQILFENTDVLSTRLNC